MKLEKEVYIENAATTGELSSFTIRGYMEDEERVILYKLRDKKARLTLEVEEPILDEAERKYLSGVIRPFRDDVEFICKNGTNIDSEYINIGYYKNDNTFLPCFKKGLMYKGMELNKEYTLGDLGL